MKSRSLGIVFTAAVIVPSILLAVLSIRSAGREEAFIERQLAASLEAQVTHTAGLANAEVGQIARELRSGLDIPPGADYARILTQWKISDPLVSVPFLLSPRYGILWPRSGARLDDEQKRFLRENGDFLSDKSTTEVLQNIALRYQSMILAETDAAKKDAAVAGPAAGSAAGAAPARQEPASAGSAPLEPTRAAPTPLSATRAASAPVSPTRAASAPVSPTRAAPADSESAPAAAVNASQMALDAFAQSPALQSKVYAEAREKGDQVASRVVQPTTTQNLSPPPGAAAVLAENDRSTQPENARAAPSAEEAAAANDEKAGTVPQAPQSQPPLQSPQAQAKPQAQQKQQAPPQSLPQPSQFVITSQLLSQIASQGDSGVIPRFIGEKLVFLFWERQKDGRIAGCEIADSQFRARIAGVLSSTYKPGYILTLLDEIGAPLATPPGATVNDWRRPFVSEPIGESLPRWEAAAYLADPGSITAQARSSSLVIWIMVLILFVSVAGGGAMVLSSVNGEMRLAQKKATFVANVSHELKTPLTSISLFVDLLRQKRALTRAKQEQYLSLMASETERLTRLINNVLDFSAVSARGGKDRSQRYAKKTIDAARVTADIVESQRVRLENRGFTVSLTGSEAPALVLADAEALKQVLLNLLSNAEKYSSGRKEIQVDVEREPARGGPGVILIHVADRGIGVPEKNRERIFREFFRGNDSLASGVQGTGLGLTIARRIARDHGGDVTCRPREGGGSDFILRLPEADA
ncbi:MAG: ATP-binding protein [Spirochaetia bacterium]